MKHRGLYFKIGLFFISIVSVLVAGIIYLQGEGFQGEPVYIETYLDESVQGLETGSIVKYRGVSVGMVQSITFVPNVYPMSVDSEAYESYSGCVMVVMKLDCSAFPGLEQSNIGIEEIIQKQVDLGLRLKLSYQGITGITFMEADYLDPDRYPPLEDLPWEPRHYYIPSAPSLMASFTQSLDNIYRRLEAMDFEGLITKMQDTLDSINTAVTEAKIPEVRESVVGLVEELRRSNKQIQDLLDKTQELPEDIQQAADQFNKTLVTIEALIERNEPDVDKLMADLKVLTQNLRQLSEAVKADPALFIFAEPPTPSENVK